MSELLLIVALLAAPDEVGALLAAADAPRVAFIGSSVTLRATLLAQGKPARTAEFVLHVGGEDRQLVEFLDGRQRGRKFLTRGDRSWLLVPGARHPIAISPNQKMFGGLAFADVARVRLAADYDGTLRAEPGPCVEDGDGPCRVVDVRARSKAAPYASGTLWIDAAGLLRRAQYALASGKPAKRVQHEYRKRGAETVLARSVVFDLINPQQALRTELEYLKQRRREFPSGWFDPGPAEGEKGSE
ncbi:MAG TPA: outer membrane lipoprotein-sorting protein [Acidiferrobacterales bacterium]